jgi:histidine phosphotransferase ChpT
MARIDECLRLAELTCARLCHDLSGLLGTIGGALELATEGDGENSEELTLAADAAREMILRLRFYRAAWGGTREGLSVPGLHALAEGLPNARSITLESHGLSHDTVLPSPVSGLVLNLLLLAAEGLPRGGRVLLAGTPSDLFVRILGPNAAWPTGLAACIADEAAALAAMSTSRAIQMPLTALMAHGHGLRLSMLMGPTPAGAPPPLRLETA